MDTVETSLQAAEDLLTRHTEVDGFTQQRDDGGGYAAARPVPAARASNSWVSTPGDPYGRAGRGIIDSLVVQDPFKMGYEGVKAVVDAPTAGRCRSESIRASNW